MDHANENEYEKKIQSTKKWAFVGCLTWFFILILGPIIFIIETFNYQMNDKENTLLISHSRKKQIQ